MQPRDPQVSHENRPLAPVYRIDDLIVDTGKVTVARAGRELALPKLSFERPDFQALLAGARANAKRERTQLDRMRADGLVPKR